MVDITLPDTIFAWLEHSLVLLSPISCITSVPTVDFYHLICCMFAIGEFASLHGASLIFFHHSVVSPVYQQLITTTLYILHVGYYW